MGRLDLTADERLAIALRAHANAMAAGADCRNCSLFGCRRGPVPSDIVIGAPLAVVGEAPARNEVDEGRPFVGWSGKTLTEGLIVGGLDRKDVAILNAIQCMPPGVDLAAYLKKLKRRAKRAIEAAKEKKEPPPTLVLSPTEACRPRLERELRRVGAKTVLALGGTALAAVTSLMGGFFAATKGKKAPAGVPRVAVVSKQHGSPSILPGGTLCASYHPAFGARAKTYMPVIYADIAKACRIALRGGRINWTEPPFTIARTVTEAVQGLQFIRADAVKHKRPVTIDIETNSKWVWEANIRCIGFGYSDATGKEHILVIPFRLINGRAFWTAANKERVAQAVADVLRDCVLSGQNLAFDSAVLDRFGLWPDEEGTANPTLWNDIMVQHHDSDHSELPHDLGFIASRFTEAPRWKEDADAKALEEVTDQDLWNYNARDCLGEHRLLFPLAQRVVACGQSAAYAIDQKMAPHVRDMGRLGLWFDHQRRLDHYFLVCKEAAKHLAAIREALGKPAFNPGSRDQVATWLFDDLGLTPVLGTDGEPWEADDDLVVDDEDDDDGDAGRDPSTSETALQALIEQGVSPEVEAVIELLFKWRAAEKLRGTYIGLREADAKILAEAAKKGRRVYDVNGLKLVDYSRLVWEQTPWGERPVLHAGWKLHTVVSGRLASSPNCQNWPSQSVFRCDCAIENEHKKVVSGDPSCKRCLCCRGNKKCKVCKGDLDAQRPVGSITINLRDMVVAPPGHVIVGADAEQIELRIYTMLAGDQKLWDAFTKGEDPHALNFCYMMWGQEGEERVRVEYAKMQAHGDGWKKHPEVEFARTCSKRWVYLTLYGGDPETAYETMRRDRRPDGSLTFPKLQKKMVYEWAENWARMHPETVAWQDGCVRFWRKNGYVESYLHHRKRFFIGGMDRNAIINHGIQSTSSDIINNAFLKIAAQIPYRGWSSYSGPMLQVHDFIGVMVPEERAQEACKIVDEAMTTKIAGMKFPVDPSKAGHSWAEV